MDSTDSSTELSEQEVQVIRLLLRNTPIAALPNRAASGAGALPLKTVADVLVYMTGIVEYLKFEMKQREHAEDELGGLARDLAAGGRLLRRMGFDK